MSGHAIDRRTFVRALPTLGAAAAAQAAAGDLVIDPAPLFDISPWLYMQFMEPLGATDSSVEAAWDYDKDDWRQDFVEATRDLAPDVVRFGGLYSRHYKWREGVGPADKRPAIRNYFWGGKETNRVGTHEFVGYCRRVGAEPLYCVNFLADGEQRFHHTPEGDRTADAREAAEWVSYANDPGHAERRKNGAADPLNIRLWQIGNETSYGDVTFTREQSIQHTLEFARAMRQRDPSIQLIGWGDRHKKTEDLWAGELLKQAGEHIDMVAIHLMGQSPKRPDTVLKGLRYQKEPERAWEELLELSNNVETRVKELEDVITASGMKKGIAVTEGHLSLPPHNANPILAEWLTAAYHARSLNIYQRHGAMVKIATAADFQGNRWTVNALTLQTPRGITYPMPVGSIAGLFRRHNGQQGVAVSNAPSGLDIAASRTGNRVYLHVANLNYRGSIQVSFAVKGRVIQGGRVVAIAPEDLRQYVGLDQPEAFKPVETRLPDGTAPKWTFPAGSVSAVELELASA
ncbi:alpha-L-arabinofuranosidase [Paludibaculum fermentans]|uniref:Alpha-L-arabinofuranosidase n=1 Tax=Paludibaculum fermentans TaxID=1473598 RepID=A0A7S7NNE4_PALFE|nr:alpha-L-arabinofuranosidase [Paludibaculum fermentans]QOY86810.1 alpha-L-arabinofuranosidase [Paludibaculum fermentans]